MSDSAPHSALFDGRLGVGHKVVLQACLWTLASLVTAFVLYAAVLLFSAQKQREAGRMMIGAQKSEGYLATVVNGYAAIQGRPRGF